MFNDIVSDMITRIRNAYKAGHKTLLCPASKFAMSVLQILLDEGYIVAYEEAEERKNIKNIIITLKYDTYGRPAIQEITRMSKPGRRSYVSVPRNKFYNGLGTIIISTSRGVMSDHKARKLNVGGEAICKVF